MPSTQIKIAILGARYGNLDVERHLLGRFRVNLLQADGRDEAEIIAASQDASIIVCGGAPEITPSVLRQLPKLTAVVRSGIGVDSIDLAECTRRGIYVANVPDYCVQEVATHAFALILTWARKLPLGRRITKNGQWDIAPLRPLQSPRDQILGLLGFGRIAQALCRMARAVGFQIWVSDPYLAKDRVRKKRAAPVALSRLIAKSDFISLHLPLTPETRHIIDAKRLQSMKPTAYLINTARGELVDENALRHALEKRWIAGAALDVMEREPPQSDHPLRRMRDVIITPHCAWYTERAQQELREKACAEVIRLLRGKAPKNLVNKDILG
jgi:D-3-phosphoglycerate dehydrogenase